MSKHGDHMSGHEDEEHHDSGAREAHDATQRDDKERNVGRTKTVQAGPRIPHPTRIRDATNG